MEAKENVQRKIEKSQFGGCTQNPPEIKSGVMVGGQYRTLFTWNCFLHFLFLVPYLLLVLLPFSFFIYRPKEEHNSGQQLNKVVTVLVTSVEKPGQHQTLLSANWDSVCNPDGDGRAAELNNIQIPSPGEGH